MKFDRPTTGCAEGDKEVYIDAVIARGKALHGDAGWDRFRRAALDGILAGIREDLADFRVEFDQWFSEKSLMDNGDVAEALNDLSPQDTPSKKKVRCGFVQLPLATTKTEYSSAITARPPTLPRMWPISATNSSADLIA